jgi:copper chaperone CopZ
VEGMHCASCVNKIETGLMKHPAITAVSVNNITQQAKVFPRLAFHQAIACHLTWR